MSQPKREQRGDHLVWIDLEMTGLDAEQDAILQAAVIITSSDLEPLEEAVFDVWQPPHVLARMVPFVRNMHEKTGLTQRVAKSTLDLGAAEQRLLEIVSGWCPMGANLCGNTIWQDRKFIDRHMPALGRYLGYRLVDVSSLKVLARTWYGDDAVFQKPKEGAHDALVDIRNSIAELKHYRATLMRPAP